MRFSLKDLLVIVTFCAAIFWCASQVGFDNGVFWFSLSASAIVSTLFVVFARTGRYGLAISTALFFVVVGLMLLSVITFINALVLIFAGVFLSFRKQPAGVKTLSFVAAIVALTVMLIGTMSGGAHFRQMVAMRKEYPIVSLEKRLAYERHPSTRSTTIRPISVSLSKRLDAFETNLDSTDHRRWQLARLHSRGYEAFVRSLGFGVSRMGPINPESISLPALRDVRFDETTSIVQGTRWGLASAFQRVGKSNDISHLHDASRDDFLDPEWFGAVIEPVRRVAGFVAHAFHNPPVASLEDPQRWAIDRLELVSLLHFDEPRVYLLDHLPRMDQLSSETVPTRPLDEFESAALVQLRTDEDLVVTHVGPAYRMLGSLRAAKQCQQCHTAERGDLLGAFSYALHDHGTDSGE